MRTIFNLLVALPLLMLAACSSNDDNQLKPEEFVPEFVDLGLSVKWATCNLGGTYAQDYGEYYGWGSTVPYQASETVDWALYFGKIGGSGTANTHCGTDKDPLRGYVKPYTASIAATKWDIARQKWGDSWRMPTEREMEELNDADKCEWQWTTELGVRGYRVTSKVPGFEGKSIFLPAAGYRNSGSTYNAGMVGSYWTSTPDAGYNYRAYYRFFNSTRHSFDYIGRYHGLTIRPVTN
ncbi:MAG: hypothetical protein HUK01_06835 [Bacteroidaceae bacterium]|nr:hypothetical protein [Bacteroidaceae bacterium]